MNDKQKIKLLSIARSAIKDSLINKKVKHYKLQRRQLQRSKEGEIEDRALFEKRATFITLKTNEELRGCIGSLTPRQPLINDIIDNSINAAFRDPRFYPLTLKEFDSVNIEISILTLPKKLEFSDKAELFQKIRPNIDGVIIKKGFYEATFLPQVWEELPDKEDFLENLCLKAGLNGDCYSDSDIQVATYEVEAFSEKDFI